MEMIKFKNLEKVCKNFDLKLGKGFGYTNVFSEENVLLISLNPYKAWDCNFNLAFNYFQPATKALLIIAMSKDYEEHLNGND